MDLFGLSDDIDFSKQFKDYLTKSKDRKQLDDELLKKNTLIIKKNIETLERCITNNLNQDNTIPYDNTFVCDGFSKLLVDNNGTKLENETKNLSQFYSPMEKIGVHPTVVNKNNIKCNHGVYVTTHTIPNDTIEKNSFGWLDFNKSSMLIRMSYGGYIFPKYNFNFYSPN